jgi:Predicted helicase
LVVSLSDENVNILDPFTGTGTFITRLLQSGHIDPKDLERKYRKEIFANEIVLLAYYIAAVNIENAFHDAAGREDYVPFDGICLTDTFQLGESANEDDLYSEQFPQNSKRVQAQKKTPLTVIFGNPPYSVGQKSANDNAQNQKYKLLDSKIADTYAAASDAGLSKSLYDSYIKAFRWSTDRIDLKNGGIIAFVSNGSWIDGNAQDGFRKVLEKEFSSIWVFNLRGNQRTSGELSRKEGGKIFGSGSRTPISLTFLVKNPKKTAEKAKIHYRDIGDYLSRDDKLKLVKNSESVLAGDSNWQTLNPNEHGDWIRHRNTGFDTYIPIEPSKKFDPTSESFFVANIIGVSTNRDPWVYNFSRNTVTANVRRFLAFYNSQRVAFARVWEDNTDLKVEDFIDADAKKISWTRSLRKDLRNNQIHRLDEEAVVISSYRPFCEQYLYFHSSLNEAIGLSRRIFPSADTDNIAICISPSGNDAISVLATKRIANLHFNGDTQCFPLFFYEEKKKESPTLFDKPGEPELVMRDGVTDFILTRARQQYGNIVKKEDIFYYVYGFLHSPEYRETFANDLKKMLPRLPLVEKTEDFWAFSKAGRKLADLHLKYESVAPHSDVVIQSSDRLTANQKINYRVQKMRFPSKGQKDTIIYNSHITLSNIPEKAYEYVINGRSAIEWIMERYQVKIDLNAKGEGSGIKNDPNDWSAEVGNPRYILDLLLSIINVSTQTVDIVNGLPRLNFE